MDDKHIKNMIHELKDNITTGDSIKARAVLSQLNQVSDSYQNRIIYELSKGSPEFTAPLLLFIMEKFPIISVQLPIIRETLLSKLLAYPELITTFLRSDEIKDKTVLIELVGDLRMVDAIPSLIELIMASSEENETLCIIESLGDIADGQAINTLTEYLYSSNREMIIAAVKSLGRIGTPTAMHRLAERMGTDNQIDILILSIFAEVQDHVSLQKLNETLRSHYAHLRTYAKKELVRIGAKAVPILIENLLQEDVDFLIHTLNVLGEIGDESAVNPIRKLITNEPRDPNVRFAAYEALAMLPLKAGAYTLTSGLTDPEEQVCIAAARAIDKNFSELLAAGLKNLLHTKDTDALHITKIIVNAQVDTVFLSLANERYFQDMAIDVLDKTHRDIRNHYRELLMKNGNTSFGMKLLDTEEESGKAKVVVVDDSRMILSIYKSTLHELGYEAVPFEFPASALEWIASEKPLMVITDLNMPDITGIQLTEKLRETYNDRELPVIMVTTQNEINDNEAAYRAGVNKVIHKPFSTESIQSAMDEVLHL